MIRISCKSLNDVKSLTKYNQLSYQRQRINFLSVLICFNNLARWVLKGLMLKRENWGNIFSSFFIQKLKFLILKRFPTFGPAAAQYIPWQRWTMRTTLVIPKTSILVISHYSPLFTLLQIYWPFCCFLKISHTPILKALRWPFPLPGSPHPQIYMAPSTSFLQCHLSEAFLQPPL